MGDGADDAYDCAMRDEYEGLFNKVWKKEIFKKMSKEFEGKVAKIVKDKIKSGQNIGKDYYKVTMEDVEGEHVLFNAWDYAAIAGIQVGKRAILDYRESPDGKFKNINKATPITDIGDDMFPTENAIETPAPPAGGNHLAHPDFRGLRIVPDNRELGIYRQSALKGAIEYHAGDEADIETIIDTAQRFVEFDLTGE